MNSTFLDVSICNKVQLNVKTEKFKQCKSFETLLCDLCTSKDTLLLLQDGDTVLSNGFELSLHEPGEIIEFKSGSFSFCLSWSDVNNLCDRFEVIASSAAVEENVELKVVDEQYKAFGPCSQGSPMQAHPTPEKNLYYESQFNGHSYMNIDEQDTNRSSVQGLDEAMSCLDNYNSFNGLESRANQFSEVRLPTITPISESFSNISLAGTDSATLGCGPKTPAIGSASPSHVPAGPASPGSRAAKRSASPPSRVGVASPPSRVVRQPLLLRSDQGDKPHPNSSSYSGSDAASDVSAAGDVADFMDVRDGPSPYFAKVNCVGKLNEHLQQHHCHHTLHYEEITHSQTSFSVNVKFELFGVLHQYTTDTRYRNKKDARQNAASIACCGLKLLFPPDDSTPSNTTPQHTAPAESGKINWKNKLQEYCQKEHQTIPDYMRRNVGNVYKPMFEATVRVTLKDGTVFEEVSRHLEVKKDAEFDVAEKAYRNLLNNVAPGGRSLAPVSSTPAKTSVTTTNWKNKLQEALQKNRQPTPRYKPAPALTGFTSTVTVSLDNEEVNFTSDVRSNAKAADMHAAELAYKAFAENNVALLSIGRSDFEDWHRSRRYAVPTFDTEPTQRYPSVRFTSTVTFNSGRDVARGEEHGSKKEADNSAILVAIQKLKQLELWDLTIHITP